MAWIRACGGNPVSNFPWDVVLLGGFDALSKTAPNGTVTYCTTSILSPTIEAGCQLSFNVSWDGSTASRSIFVEVSTDGNAWTSVGSHTGTSSYIATVPLASYAGSGLYVRVGFSNSQGTGTQMHVNSMTII